MKSKLPLVVGFGGYNSAGRSSGHRAYERTIYESLNGEQRSKVLQSLAGLMGLDASDEDAILSGTLVRKIESNLFDPDQAPLAKNVVLNASESDPITFEATSKQLPENLPPSWKVKALDADNKRFEVTVQGDLPVRVDTASEMSVKAAGQLPSGFDPGAYYRSQNHPRGLKMSVMGASDAILSMGIDWAEVINKIDPNDVAVYSTSAMSQVDHYGFGGVFSARNLGQRVTSKQLALGLGSMPADFTNAYVLGSLGTTGAVAGACATFLYNLRWGVEEIRSGRRKVVVVGVSEAPIVPEVLDGYAAMSALATDEEIARLDGLKEANLRRASRPFGNNCGFTLAESCQYAVLMADDLALELGANVYGAVPGVFVNADGYKKSISSPGAGNYITLSKAVALARTMVGEDVVRNSSFVQAHGSSTPQNRTTESKIFNDVAQAFGIESWPVAAIKSYVGHSLGPASGDQLVSALGIFDYGILPGIKTIDGVANDVFADRLNLSKTDVNLGQEGAKVGFLNSKGFGGNNASATVLAPSLVSDYFERHYSKDELSRYYDRREETLARSAKYLEQADKGELKAIYEFGNNIVDESKIEITQDAIRVPGYKNEIALGGAEGFDDF